MCRQEEWYGAGSGRLKPIRDEASPTFCGRAELPKNVSPPLETHDVARVDSRGIGTTIMKMRWLNEDDDVRQGHHFDAEQQRDKMAPNQFKTTCNRSQCDADSSTSEAHCAMKSRDLDSWQHYSSRLASSSIAIKYIYSNRFVTPVENTAGILRYNI